MSNFPVMHPKIMSHVIFEEIGDGYHMKIVTDTGKKFSAGHLHEKTETLEEDGQQITHYYVYIKMLNCQTTIDSYQWMIGQIRSFAKNNNLKLAHYAYN